MAPSAVQQNVEAASASYSATFPPGQGSLDGPPSKQCLVVTCMDARLNPAAAFGIQIGEAHVVRNAGASAIDALRSIVISQQFLGTKEVILVKHTKCGMAGLENEKALEVIEGDLGSAAVDELKQQNVTDFIGFHDLDTAVKEDVKFLKECKAIKPGTEISGWVYDVTTGTTTRVV